MQSNLIIDVGMHTGKDTEFYLQKGFCVIGIEANPLLAENVKERLHLAIDEERLTVLNVAIASYEGIIDLYVNTQKDDWSTIDPSFVRRNLVRGTQHNLIRVPCMRMESVLQDYGVPYYLKIDIEGADYLCLASLNTLVDRPKYISVELELDDYARAFTQLSQLWMLGYRKFKIVNQALNLNVRCPNPPREGRYVDMRFDGQMSGPFGDEAPGTWETIDQILERYRRLHRGSLGAASRTGPTLARHYNPYMKKAYTLFRRVTNYAPFGWYDLHAEWAPHQTEM
jgi:FkbM family methyltransferase